MPAGPLDQSIIAIRKSSPASVIGSLFDTPLNCALVDEPPQVPPPTPKEKQTVAEKQRSQTTQDLSTLSPSENSPQADAALTRYKVHCVLMNKGGVGKTIVSMNLVQYLRDKKLSVQAIDLDPSNHTMTEYHAILAKPVSLLMPGHTGLKGQELDTLAQAMLTDEASFVIDNGSSGFVHMGGYLAETEFAELLAERNRDLLVHAVIAGGDMMSQCILGLHTILTSFPASVRVVVWLNEHSGPAEIDGRPFNDMRIYRDNEDRFAGVVMMPALKPLFLKDFDAMLRKRLTYDEAISSPDFFIINKQRLIMVRRAVWGQLNEIGIV